MANDASTTGHDDPMDLPAHEGTYAAFLKLVEVMVVVLLAHVLLLVLWGIEGHGFVALIEFVLILIAGAIGWATDLSWRAPLPIFLLIGLTCIVL
jgi:hypothetical protein